ncbi:MAG: hypothetical protein AAFR04_05935 [Pseudomonadota bacterium]
MSLFASLDLDDIKARGSIKDADVKALRRALFDDGTITDQEAEALFELNTAVAVKDPQWGDLFIEALTDYTVHQAQPEGYMTAENAAWFIERISTDGKVETNTELELLIRVIDAARWAPASLVRFALAQVHQAVVSGAGVLRSGKTLAPGVIDEADIELVRRIVYAFAGDDAIAVSRAEAELLFDINDAIADPATDQPAGWTDLFSKAIANHIMAASGYRVPPRQEALRREAWLEERGELSLAAFASRIAEAGLGGIWSAYTEQSAEERAIARLEQQKIEIVTNEAVTEGEAEWLAARIGEGALHPNEAALLMFIKRESPNVHPSLEPLISKAAAQAA